MFCHYSQKQEKENNSSCEQAQKGATIKYTRVSSWMVEYFWQQYLVLLVTELPLSSSVRNEINKGLLFGKRGFEHYDTERSLSPCTLFPMSSHQYRFTVREKITYFWKLCYSTVFIFVLSSLLSEWLVCIYHTLYHGMTSDEVRSALKRPQHPSLLQTVSTLANSVIQNKLIRR